MRSTFGLFLLSFMRFLKADTLQHWTHPKQHEFCIVTEACSFLGETQHSSAHLAQTVTL